MGALKGSLSYVRLFVQGDLPDDFQDTFVRRIRLRAMKPLDPLEDALERSGWCSIEKPFDTDLDYEKVFFNNFVNLGFRTDRWAIPGPLLKVKLEEAEAAYLKKKGREKIGRKERQELKDMVAKKLRREVAPAMRVVDLSWSLEQGIVRFFSHGQKPIALVVELFEKTFGLKLDIESPYVTAARRGLSKDDSRAFERLEPVSFASFAIPVEVEA
jgi:recombination associated protein RdgC